VEVMNLLTISFSNVPLLDTFEMWSAALLVLISNLNLLIIASPIG
jgi:ABC-type transport system involved in cytochrome bd biosynthesis fused ATPase/permease subunit